MSNNQNFIIDLQNIIISASNLISENIEIVFGFAGMVITWWVVHYLNLKQQKELLRNNAKMKIYGELYELKKDIDRQGINLDLLINSFSIKLLEMENIHITKKISDPVEKNYEAFKIWNRYILDISQKNCKFSNSYLKFWNHAEMWISVMSKLKRGKKELFEIQFKKLMDNLYKHEDYLRDLSVKNYKWKEWNKEDIKNRSSQINEEFDKIAVGYLDDFMVEIHNCLVGPIFGHKKMYRENFENLPTKYEVLTKDGIKKIKKSN
jgi:hypothetical protein